MNGAAEIVNGHPDLAVVALAFFAVAYVAIEITKLVNKARQDDPAEITRQVIHDILVSVKKDTTWIKEVHDVRTSDGRLVWWNDPEIKKVSQDMITSMKHLDVSITNLNKKIEQHNEAR